MAENDLENIVALGLDALVRPGTTTPRELARGVLAALREAGYVIVKRQLLMSGPVPRRVG